MNQALIDEVTKRLSAYPLYSQEGASDHLVIVKLFNAFGAGVWYLVEYGPEEERAFGYTTGFGGDEWGYISLPELASLYCDPGCTVPVVEIDMHFKPTVFSGLGVKK
jgi:hypothetical protein